MMQWIDVCAGVAAMRHATGPVVTASIDRLDFIYPVHVRRHCCAASPVQLCAQDLLIEVGCRVETEDMKSGSRRYTTKAYLTFVALKVAGRAWYQRSPLKPPMTSADLTRV